MSTTQLMKLPGGYLSVMDRLESFQSFCDWFNAKVGGDLEFDGTLDLDSSFRRHFTQERQKPGVRMSNLGKPAIVSALYKLGYSEPEPKGMLRYIFFLGDVFENALEVFLANYGFKIIATQMHDPNATRVHWNGLTGHFDFIVEDVNGNQTLIEAKTMSGNYSRTFQSSPNDDRGYLTQLALYTDATGIPGMWLCMDKSTGMIFPVEPNPGVLQASLLRADKVLQRLQSINSLEDVITKFKAPPVNREEVYQKQGTGRYFVPQSMAYSPFKSAVYKISSLENGYGKMTDYVEGYADVEHMRNELDFLVGTGKLVFNPPEA